jgi:DNA-directed RNA polymerase subunit RPC12/RpoP
MEIKLKCEYCGSDNLDSFVNGNSYIFKCLNCKKDGPATSFMSISKELQGQYELIEVDQDLNRRETIWTGEIEEGIDRIRLETSKRKLIWLKKLV